MLEVVKQSPKLLETIYSDLAQPGVKKVGQALETVLELSNTFLLPIKLLNERTRLIFEQNMKKYKDKLEEIPDENVCEVLPEFGIPLLDKLTYIRNEEISGLFVNLLIKASSKDTCNSAHPSFIQIVSSLSVDEAIIINHLSKKNICVVPFISFKADTKDGRGFIYAAQKLTGLERELELLFPDNINFYLDNLVGLGIINYQEGVFLIDNPRYEELEIIYQTFRKEQNEKLSDKCNEIRVKQGFFEVTGFGMKFINACTMNSLDDISGVDSANSA